MRSMTGYGEAWGDHGRFRIRVTVRSVNHRFLDLSLRLPEICSSAEPMLRELVAAHVRRGRVEVRAEVEAMESGPPEVEVRAELARALIEACRDVARESELPVEVSVDGLLRVPEVLRIKTARQVWGEEDTAELLKVASQAMGAATAARGREGERLLKVLAGHLADLRRLVAELGARRETANRALHERLRRRLEELLGELPVEEERLVREAALLAERADVSEELDRLDAHLDHLAGLLESEGPIGKRLDFGLQEAARELNTLAAKCRDTEMVRLVLDAKLACERFREQARNVE